MRRRSAVLTFVATVLLFGCTPPPRPKPPFNGTFRGLNPSSGREVSLTYSPTPISLSISGKWVSPQLGVITLQQHDDKVDGAYDGTRDGCHVVGKLTDGKSQGNLVQFSWTDQRVGCPSAGASKGTGFVFFSHDESGPRLFGRRRAEGADDRPDETWTAMPQAVAAPSSDAGAAPPVDPICKSPSGPADAGAPKTEGP